MSKEPVLETERLILRPPTLDEAEACFSWNSDERVTKFMSILHDHGHQRDERLDPVHPHGRTGMELGVRPEGGEPGDRVREHRTKC